MTGARRVIAYLEERGIASAVIGGVALASYGIARATLDVDLLASDRGVLRDSFWTDLGARVETRPGDDDDPLEGVARIEVDGEVVDVVLVKGAWVRGVLDRRRVDRREGFEAPVVDPADLVLLKLVGGGPQDRVDVELLLRHAPEIRATVESRLAPLPTEARELWARLTRA